VDQRQRAGVVTAVYLLVVAAGVVLYFLGSANGRRQWAAIEHRRLLVAFILASARRLKAVSAFLWGAALMLLLEVIQLLLPGYVFDPFDIFAGVCGAALTAMFLARRARNNHGNVLANEDGN